MHIAYLISLLGTAFIQIERVVFIFEWFGYLLKCYAVLGSVDGVLNWKCYFRTWGKIQVNGAILQENTVKFKSNARFSPLTQEIPDFQDA